MKMMRDTNKQPTRQPSEHDHQPTIAAMVTLYNSDPEVIRHIGSYINQVSKLYVIDNSEKPDEKLLEQIKTAYSNVEYVSNNGNHGIAYALNAAAQAAQKEGFSYLLTMDDDSEASEDMISTMLNYIEKQLKPENIGIISAQADSNLFSDEAKKTWYTITSGSLLNLKAYQRCGPFLDELFIDAVDHEYCFRLIECGYQVISLNYLHLKHSIGELKRLSVFNKTIYKWASHNPVRNYYMLRNFLYVINKYKSMIPVRTKLLLFYGLTKVCLLNSMLEKDTLLRLRYMSKAISDFRNNKLGKLTQIID